MPKKQPKTNLRCPDCYRIGKIYTRISKNDRICRACGFTGPKPDFIYSPSKAKKQDLKVPIPDSSGS